MPVRCMNDSHIDMVLVTTDGPMGGQLLENDLTMSFAHGSPKVGFNSEQIENSFFIWEQFGQA